MKCKPISADNCAIFVILYFLSRLPYYYGNKLAEGNTTESQLNAAKICGQRSFCSRFPSLCRAFGKSLFDEFRPGELPFIGHLRIIERYSDGDAATKTRQCLAVAISDRDLLVNGECLESSKTKSNENSVIVKNDYDKEQNFEVTPLDSKKLSLITTIDKAMQGMELIKFLPSDVTKWIKCAIAGNEKVKIDGIVCGLMPTGDLTLQYACRSSHASSVYPLVVEAKSPNFSQNEFNDLLAGAAIFRHSTNDVWSLIGFTNTDGTVISLSQADCTSIERLTRGRVDCAANVSATAAPGRELLFGRPFYLNYGDSAAEQRGSALFPLIILSMILLMAVIIFGFLIRESTTRRSYQYI